MKTIDESEKIEKTTYRHGSVVEEGAVGLLGEELEAEMRRFAHLQRRVPGPAGAVEGARRLLTARAVEAAQALALHRSGAALEAAAAVVARRRPARLVEAEVARGARALRLHLDAHAHQRRLIVFKFVLFVSLAEVFSLNVLKKLIKEKKKEIRENEKRTLLALTR